MENWIRVASSEEVPEGAGREFVVEGKVVALFRVQGTCHAIDGLCPHAGGPIGTGTLRGCVVTCPWHGWQFDVSTGKHTISQIQTTCYPVEEREGAVWLNWPE